MKALPISFLARARVYRKRLTWQLVALLIMISIVLTGCRLRSRVGNATITIAGSTSVQPFIELLAEEYARSYPDRPAVNVQGGGSSAGGRAVLTEVAQIGMLSRQPEGPEQELTVIPVAYDALAVVVNPQNPISALSSNKIRAIFSGAVAQWSELDQTKGRIHIVSREEGSGTRAAFDSLIMANADVAARAIVQDSNGAVREIVAHDPHAIGYISLGLVNHRVKAIQVDKVQPTQANCRAGKYTLVRPFLFVVKEPLDAASQEFIDFVLSEYGQKLLAEHGLVAVNSNS